MYNPHLVYEFRNAEGNIEPIFFTEPVKVLETHDLQDIPRIMEEIEKALAQGFYAAGYVSYEAAPAFQAEMQVKAGAEMPLIWFGIFRQPKAPEPEPAAEPYRVSSWRMASSEDQYKKGIADIKTAIEEGHTYQVNYTERLHASFSGSDRSFYRQLARNQQAGYGAYLNLGRYRILSASPELFFRVQDGRLTTKPMKGTAARGRNLAEDRAKAQQLLASEKERAENLMIVDLLRNDMSRLAESGTVQASKLFEVEAYPTVLQLTSTIEADLVPGLTVYDWFKALFPCGSITGAPKISTMQFIAALEQSPREVYCGAIGFITPEKNAVFSVPIRTVVVDAEKGNAQYGVGGGITWDSTSEGEFEELYAKAKVLTAERPEFSLLESLKLEDGVFPLLPYHLNRLEASAKYFGFPADLAKVEQRLAACAEAHPQGLYKVRLLVDKMGGAVAEAQPLQPTTGRLKAVLAKEPVDSSNPFLFHKTTHRKVYDEAQQDADTAFTALLWNENGELTEFTIGNLVVEKDGRFFTPPVESGLLAGTFRQQLLDNGNIEERIVRKDSLAEWDAVWFINGVRGWVEIDIGIPVKTQ
ncbi:para-aminobenzoate synthetase/4-amino-4-deoxychorismate lyase [Planomicrobium koreense]|uniref:Para-aminobenzoate synthetase/4-amino-4-deoxychorismate lyase n=1 Tax=Planococcus koreensis TaxID=112331 RepID=A0A7W8CRH8_9BACL|nr:aminodeoxychorismate synthase component I [Planococcus koreensis]MBB5180312.1 para-aminobenzoate synthetase/4-amino-4-deoxychorismate lyase [Planococcus koreensis]